MSRFISYALWKPFSLSGLQELHDQGVTEVMLFPLYPQHAMASTTTILELAEDHRKKVFSRNEIYDSSCIINQTIYKTLLIL
jgi:protoheme ferro-lyase